MPVVPFSPILTPTSKPIPDWTVPSSTPAACATGWSSQANTLPIAKSQTRTKQNKDMHKCSSVYSERGVLLPVLTSGGTWVGVRACKTPTRVPPSLCNATQTSDPANPPPCACRARLRDVCSTRHIRTVRPEPLHPHVCDPHVALEMGDLKIIGSLNLNMMLEIEF
jgi:hypothetical protein